MAQSFHPATGRSTSSSSSGLASRRTYRSVPSTPVSQVYPPPPYTGSHIPRDFRTSAADYGLLTGVVPTPQIDSEMEPAAGLTRGELAYLQHSHEMPRFTRQSIRKQLDDSGGEVPIYNRHLINKTGYPYTMGTPTDEKTTESSRGDRRPSPAAAVGSSARSAATSVNLSGRWNRPTATTLPTLWPRHFAGMTTTNSVTYGAELPSPPAWPYRGRELWKFELGQGGGKQMSSIDNTLHRHYAKAPFGSVYGRTMSSGQFNDIQ
ncbi:hypothetical protein FOL47_001496 [Perkinsus chesapeaki]|uniref:Uncharacterized protein n=1 Tax=Perkinsus chesapeaki TaxID=330153 RepID=A0A7J6MIZ4_PERCH|nr:hypothetical protein FOL47_001496 [Perkinsus chesapeaki]